MKLSDYIKTLKIIFDEYGDIDLVYSSDDEGNSYSKVWCHPSEGQFCHSSDFIPKDQFSEYDDSYEFKVNAVCIN